MDDWRETALQLQRQLAAQPCSFCGRRREQLPADAQHLCLLVDESSNTADLVCDECMIEIAPRALTRFTISRQQIAQASESGKQ